MQHKTSEWPRAAWTRCSPTCRTCRRTRSRENDLELVRRISDARRLAIRNPFYVAQKMIILGWTDVLLKQFAERIPGLEESVSPE